jgi:hypothetical protein
MSVHRKPKWMFVLCVIALVVAAGAGTATSAQAANLFGSSGTAGWHDVGWYTCDARLGIDQITYNGPNMFAVNAHSSIDYQYVGYTVYLYKETYPGSNQFNYTGVKTQQFLSLASDVTNGLKYSTSFNVGPGRWMLVVSEVWEAQPTTGILPLTSPVTGYDVENAGLCWF